MQMGDTPASSDMQHQVLVSPSTSKPHLVPLRSSECHGTPTKTSQSKCAYSPLHASWRMYLYLGSVTHPQGILGYLYWGTLEWQWQGDYYMAQQHACMTLIARA